MVTIIMEIIRIIMRVASRTIIHKVDLSTRHTIPRALIVVEAADEDAAIITKEIIAIV